MCCDDEVQIRHRAAERERMSAERRRFGLDELPAEIADEIDGMFSGKNYEELVSMEEDIRRRIQGSSSTSSTVPAAPEKPEEVCLCLPCLYDLGCSAIVDSWC